jgi:hypothetical protein
MATRPKGCANYWRGTMLLGGETPWVEAREWSEENGSARDEAWRDLAHALEGEFLAPVADAVMKEMKFLAHTASPEVMQTMAIRRARVRAAALVARA